MSQDKLLDNSRVVTGLDAEGRSTILFSGPAPAQQTWLGLRAAHMWQTNATPADNAGTNDAAATLFDTINLTKGATRFVLVEFPGTAGLDEQERAARADAYIADSDRARSGSDRPGMHTTNTLDYVIVLRGEITLVVDTGEVALKAGDVVVDRGVAHAWENRGSEPTLIAAITIDAIPINQPS